MRIYKAKDYEEMSRKAAGIVSAQIIMKPDCVLGLATGSTPVGLYKQLIEWYRNGDLDFSGVRTVNLDEYKGISRENDQSYYYFENCRQCGGCSVGDMLGLAHKYGIHMAVATGGTLARQMVKQIRPKAIVAVACERDLTSGIQDVFPLPVVGVLNERPFGPCFNTRVDIKRVEAAVLDFLEVEEKHGEH